MTDSDELERIRRQKRERLRNRDGDDEDASSGGDEPAPAEPVRVEDEEQFRTLVAEHDVVLVDFHADWCGPCQMLEPTVAEIARDTPAAVAKVDVDRHEGLAGQHGVRGVPTLVLYAGGEPAEQLVGVQEADQLRTLIDRHA